MSTLFKWELAALLLGGLLGFWQLAREEKRPFSALLRTWWSSERWFFCTGGENFRRAMAEPAAVIVLFALYFYGVLTGAFCAVSGFSEEWAFWGASQMVLLTAAFVLKTTLFTRYSGWQLVVMGLVMGYFALLQVITGYRPLAQAALLMVLLKDVDLKRCLRWVMGFIVGNVAIKALLVWAGLIGNQVQVWDNGRTRMDLGQGSMNALGILVAQAAVLWLVTRFGKLRWWDLVLAAAALWFIEEVPNSRSAMMFELLAVAGMLAIKFLPKLFQKTPFQILCCLPAPAIAAVMWWFHYHYDKDVAWMAKLDALFTGRISLSYITQYEEIPYGGIRPFGQIFVNDRFYRVDDSYIYYAYLCGPLMVLLLCGGFALLTWKLMRSGRPELAICVMTYACYAAMERCLSTINFSLLLLPALLFGAAALRWPKENRKGIGKES